MAINLFAFCIAVRSLVNHIIVKAWLISDFGRPVVSFVLSVENAKTTFEEHNRFVVPVLYFPLAIILHKEWVLRSWAGSNNNKILDDIFVFLQNHKIARPSFAVFVEMIKVTVAGVTDVTLNSVERNVRADNLSTPHHVWLCVVCAKNCCIESSSQSKTFERRKLDAHTHSAHWSFQKGKCNWNEGELMKTRRSV